MAFAPLDMSGAFHMSCATHEYAIQELHMAECAWCHNEYDKPFSVTYGDQTYVFDSFECAITMLAPTCAHCKCRIIGHGDEVDGRFYCCASCARAVEAVDIHDRVTAGHAGGVG